MSPKFCSNCGQKLENENDAFCPNCGNPIQTDSNELNASIKETTSKASKKVSQFGTSIKNVATKVSSSSIWSRLGKMFTGIFTKPSETIVKYATPDNSKLGIVLIVLGAFVFLLPLQQIYYSLSRVLYLFMGYSSMLSGDYGYQVNYYQGYWSTGLKVIIFYLIAILVLILLTSLISKVIFKKDLNFKVLTSSLGLINLAWITIAIVGWLLSYVNISLGIFVIMIGVLFLFLLYYEELNLLGKLEKDQAIYTTLIIAAIFLVLSALITSI